MILGMATNMASSIVHNARFRWRRSDGNPRQYAATQAWMQSAAEPTATANCTGSLKGILTGMLKGNLASNSTGMLTGRLGSRPVTRAIEVTHSSLTLGHS